MGPLANALAVEGVKAGQHQDFFPLVRLEANRTNFSFADQPGALLLAGAEGERVERRLGQKFSSGSRIRLFFRLFPSLRAAEEGHVLIGNS